MVQLSYKVNINLVRDVSQLYPEWHEVISGLYRTEGVGKGGNCRCKKVHKLTHYLGHTRLLLFYVEHAPFRVGRIVITRDLVVVWCVSHAVFFHS